MKKVLTLITLLLVSTPVFAETVDCGIISEITRPAAHIILVIAPIILLVMGTIDFLGAVTAGDEKAMKKATSTFLKRLIICIVIMVLPALVNMVISFTQYNDFTSCL